MKSISEKMKERENQLNLCLKDRGFTVQYMEKKDNNMVKDGYIVRKNEEDISPIVYYDPRWFNLPDEEVSAFLIDINENSRPSNVLRYLDPEYVLSHVRPMLLGESNIKWIEDSGMLYHKDENFVILFYERVEDLSWLEEKGEGIIKLTNAICEHIGLSKDEIYRQAFENMEKDMTIMPMKSALMEMVEQNIEYQEEDPTETIYVVSNRNCQYGAASILSKTAYEQLSSVFGHTFIILQSSIHECLVIPYDENADLHYYTQMVNEINMNEVQPEDRLANYAYIYDGNTMQRID